MVADIRGVVLTEEAGGARVEFSNVTSVLWTSSEFIIAGTVYGPGRITNGVYSPPNPYHGQTRSITFALDDVSRVLVHGNANQAEVGVGMLVGAALAAPTFLYVLVLGPYRMNMNRFGGIMVMAGVAGSLMSTACQHVLSSEPLPPLPSPEVRLVADLRGIVLRGPGGGERFMFSHVSGLRWTPSAIVVTGTADAPGNPDHGQTRTITFALDEVDYLLVREYDARRSLFLALGLGGLLGILSVLIALR